MKIRVLQVALHGQPPGTEDSAQAGNIEIKSVDTEQQCIKDHDLRGACSVKAEFAANISQLSCQMALTQQ